MTVAIPFLGGRGGVKEGGVRGSRNLGRSAALFKLKYRLPKTNDIICSFPCRDPPPLPEFLHLPLHYSYME